MPPASHAAKAEDPSRRFLNELIARELSNPVDRFIEHRVQPQAAEILDRYRAQLDDLAARLQSLSTGAMEAVALFRAAVAQAAEQLREDADLELVAAFDFAAKIESTGALQTYVTARIDEVFTAASMTAADEIRPLLARLLPPEHDGSAAEANEQAPSRPRYRKRRASPT
jgi:uncharacterized coiled-coil protein SlyX